MADIKGMRGRHPKRHAHGPLTTARTNPIASPCTKSRVRRWAKRVQRREQLSQELKDDDEEELT